MATGNNELVLASAKNTKDAEFLAHMGTAGRAKEEYAQLYLEMVDTLSTQHFEEFASILKEKANIILNQEEFLNLIKNKFLITLLSMLDYSWENSQIGENISILEIMKEKCRKSPGCNWRPHGEDANMQTLPIRMRYKNSQYRWLQEHVAEQQLKLNNFMEITTTNRKQIKKIQKTQRFMSEKLESGKNQLVKFKEDYPKFIDQVLYYKMEYLRTEKQKQQQQDTKEHED